MRDRFVPITLALALALALPVAARKAAPPRFYGSAEIQSLVDKLADDDLAIRREAMKKLEECEEAALPALRRASRLHPDPDVRLRALVVMRAIDTRYWGEIKSFGAGAALTTVPWGGGYWFNRVAFTPDGKYAVIGGGALILFDLETGKEVGRILEVRGARPGLSLSADGKYCLTGHNGDPVVHLVELPSLKVVRRFIGHRLGVIDVALSSDARLAASADGQSQIILWDADTGKEFRRITGFAGQPRCLAFSPDGKQLLSGHLPQGQASLIRLWDVETGKEVRALDGHDKRHGVFAVRFLPDGKRGVSASLDGVILLWDLQTGKTMLKIHHPGGVYDLAVSADGKRALSAGFEDRRVRLWNLLTGKEIRALDGHIIRVLGVALSADGRKGLSCDAVSTVRLWKLGK